MTQKVYPLNKQEVFKIYHQPHCKILHMILSLFILSVRTKKKKPHFCSDLQVRCLSHTLLVVQATPRQHEPGAKGLGGEARGSFQSSRSPILRVTGTGLACTTQVGSPHYSKDFGSARQRSLV